MSDLEQEIKKASNDCGKHLNLLRMFDMYIQVSFFLCAFPPSYYFPNSCEADHALPGNKPL